MILCRYQKTITTQIQISTVFDFLSDLTNLPLWVSDICRVHRLDVGPIIKGSQFECFLGHSLLDFGQNVKIIHLESNKRVVYLTQNEHLNIKHSFQLLDCKNKTQITFRSTLTTSSTNLTIMNSLIEPIYAERNRCYIQNLCQGLNGNKNSPISWQDKFASIPYRQLIPFFHMGLTQTNQEFFLESLIDKQVVLLSDEHYLTPALALELCKRRVEIHLVTKDAANPNEVQALCKRLYNQNISIHPSDAPGTTFINQDAAIINLDLDFTRCQAIIEELAKAKLKNIRFIQISSLESSFSQVTTSDLHPAKKPINAHRFKRKNHRAMSLYIQEQHKRLYKKGITLINLLPEVNQEESFFKLTKNKVPWIKKIIDNDSNLISSILWAVSQHPSPKLCGKVFFENKPLPFDKFLFFGDQKQESKAIESYLKKFAS